MSFTEILSELPHLTRTQREEILHRLCGMDEGLWVDSSISREERQIIDLRLKEAGESGQVWSRWEDVKARIAGKVASP